MKILIITLALITAGAAQEYKLNEEGFMVPADKFEWTTSSKTLLYSYLTLSAVDLAQTINFLERGTAHEANPLFGKNPEIWKLVTAKVIGSYVIYEIFNRGISEELRPYFLTTFILVQGYVVHNNSQYVNFGISF